MTHSEFKAWFEGFVEGIEGTPTLKQWKRVKAKVQEIDGEPINRTYITTYVDRWYPHLAPAWYTVGGASTTTTSGQAVYTAATLTNVSPAAPTVYSVLKDEGMREAQSLS